VVVDGRDEERLDPSGTDVLRIHADEQARSVRIAPARLIQWVSLQKFGEEEKRSDERETESHLVPFLELFKSCFEILVMSIVEQCDSRDDALQIR
jgi:hypothetical protein